LLVNLLNPINTHLYILNLNTLIYLHEPGDLAKSNLVIHFSAILSQMTLVEANLVIDFPTFLSRIPLAEANLVIRFSAFLSWMPLVEANLVIHLSAIFSRMPLAETNLVDTLYFIYIKHDIYCNCIHQKNFKCISAKMRGNHALAPPVLWPPLIEDLILVALLESQGSFWLLFLQADIIENPYSFITHMLLSMHVHFLIITNIHISCIFSKLVSQCASVRMTQFFYIFTYNIHIKVYCYCPTVTVQPLLSRHWTVTIWTLIILLTISRVLELHFKWDWSHWKVNTRGYKFSKGRRT